MDKHLFGAGVLVLIALFPVGMPLIALAQVQVPFKSAAISFRDSSSNTVQESQSPPPSAILWQWTDAAGVEGQANSIETKSVSNGLTLSGNYAYNRVGSVVTLTVDQIRNDSVSRTTGSLRLELWATTTLPSRGQGFTGYRLATSGIFAPLAPQYLYNNVSQTVGFGVPPDGTYWIVMALSEYDSINCSTGDHFCLTDSGSFTSQQTFGVPPDTRPPTVPAGLTATAVSTSVINLAWYASTDNVAVTIYRVFQNGTSIGTVSSLGASISGLSASTTYSFAVSACDAAGNCSAQSFPVSATTFAIPAPPPTADLTGAWYNASESGWGLSVIRGNSGAYGVIMYHYDEVSSPTWYFMSGGNFSGNTFSAPAYLFYGPWYASPFNSASVGFNTVGRVSINFTSGTSATITYTIGSITVTKNITKIVF